MTEKTILANAIDIDCLVEAESKSLLLKNLDAGFRGLELELTRKLSH